MSKYTTGEIAKLCGVSVRTVQYYDDRGILIPSELSEGGRRLYSEEDLKKMKIICFLRDAGLPIKSIEALFAEEKPEGIISLLLEEQEQIIEQEISERSARLDIIRTIKREIRERDNFSVDSIGDIAQAMEQKNKRTKMLRNMLIFGIPLAALQISSIILWITNGFWWLFVIWACAAIPFGIVASAYYYKHTAFICPECHEVFRAGFKEVFFAYHTPRMRRLTCPKCKCKCLCLEIFHEEKTK